MNAALLAALQKEPRDFFYESGTPPVRSVTPSITSFASA